jgi:hypothetical protein
MLRKHKKKKKIKNAAGRLNDLEYRIKKLEGKIDKIKGKPERRVR